MNLDDLDFAIKHLSIKGRYAPRKARRSSRRDIVIRDHVSIVLLETLTIRAHEWLVEHTQDAQWFGEALAVEPRYVADIVNGAVEEGLVVRHGYGGT